MGEADVTSRSASPEVSPAAVTCAMHEIYLINPAENAPGYFGLEVLGAWTGVNATAIADLATPTVAAFAPDNWKVTICEERLDPVDFSHPARYVGITGKVTQQARMIELAAEFRRRGKIVLIGGSYASLSPDALREHCDILVIGEIEEIAGELFEELALGKYKSTYQGGKPALVDSPVPRWDLYPLERTWSAQVQTSRGCPFDCEFCDVIQYLGRKQRWKEPDQITAELDILRDRGVRGVFFADDNLTVMRRRTRALLERLLDWNTRPPDERLAFATQVSIDISRDHDILALMRNSGFETLFVGIETPNEQSLAEAGKRQNLRHDMIAQVETIVQHGMMVYGGIIVGFDQDGVDIFERQFDFIQSMPLPLISPGVLVAPETTPLHTRLLKEGRLTEGSDHSASLISTNIIPAQMSKEQLRSGMTWLLNRLFAPIHFMTRLERYVALSGERKDFQRQALFAGPTALLARELVKRGPAEYALVRAFDRASVDRPDLVVSLTTIFSLYCQARHMLEVQDLWQPDLARFERPAL
ncbi:radical SAM protein [Rhizobium sp. AAP116]|uniref:radical SAM protein n=1 Tax=Rhizobium sp. AAP116 TaxID=1523429 RepID=UPI0018D09524|nr:radical SAM protein [Rhizobium sp. AAP116]